MRRNIVVLGLVIFVILADSLGFAQQKATSVSPGKTNQPIPIEIAKIEAHLESDYFLQRYQQWLQDPSNKALLEKYPAIQSSLSQGDPQRNLRGLAGQLKATEFVKKIPDSVRASAPSIEAALFHGLFHYHLIQQNYPHEGAQDLDVNKSIQFASGLYEKVLPSQKGRVLAPNPDSNPELFYSPSTKRFLYQDDRPQTGSYEIDLNEICNLDNNARAGKFGNLSIQVLQSESVQTSGRCMIVFRPDVTARLSEKNQLLTLSDSGMVSFSNYSKAMTGVHASTAFFLTRGQPFKLSVNPALSEMTVYHPSGARLVFNTSTGSLQSISNFELKWGQFAGAKVLKEIKPNGASGMMSIHFPAIESDRLKATDLGKIVDAKGAVCEMPLGDIFEFNRYKNGAGFLIYIGNFRYDKDGTMALLRALKAHCPDLATKPAKEIRGKWVDIRTADGALAGKKRIPEFAPLSASDDLKKTGPSAKTQ